MITLGRRRRFLLPSFRAAVVATTMAITVAAAYPEPAAAQRPSRSVVVPQDDETNTASPGSRSSMPGEMPAMPPRQPPPSIPPDPDPINERWYQALEQYRKGNLAEAARLAESVSKARPSTKVSLLLVRIARDQNDFINARMRLVQVLDADPTNKAAHILSGDLFLRQKEYLKAKNSYETALQYAKGGKDYDITLKLVYTTLGLKELPTANRLVKELAASTESTDPTEKLRPNYYFAKAAISYAMGRPTEADKTLENVRSMFETSVFYEYLAEYIWLYPTSLALRPHQAGPTAQKAEDAGDSLGKGRGAASAGLDAPTPAAPSPATGATPAPTRSEKPAAKSATPTPVAPKPTPRKPATTP
ncbi:hypothetical protein DB346_04205 [Verrucomicrobia bacterium LW23]|nr:hypothetical protein DB346_04205 [Verrucomicrobia bacterium LW23]